MRPVVDYTGDAGSWLPQSSRDGLGVNSERTHRDHLCGPNESRQSSATTQTARRQYWNHAAEKWACPPVSIPSPAAQPPDRELEHHRYLQSGETSINRTLLLDSPPSNNTNRLRENGSHGADVGTRRDFVLHGCRSDCLLQKESYLP